MVKRHSRRSSGLWSGTKISEAVCARRRGATRPGGDRHVLSCERRESRGAPHDLPDPSQAPADRGNARYHRSASERDRTGTSQLSSSAARRLFPICRGNGRGRASSPRKTRVTVGPVRYDRRQLIWRSHPAQGLHPRFDQSRGAQYLQRRSTGEMSGAVRPVHRARMRTWSRRAPTTVPADGPAAGPSLPRGGPGRVSPPAATPGVAPRIHATTTEAHAPSERVGFVFSVVPARDRTVPGCSRGPHRFARHLNGRHPHPAGAEGAAAHNHRKGVRV